MQTRGEFQVKLHWLYTLVTKLPWLGVEDVRNLHWVFTALTLVFKQHYYKLEPYIGGLVFTNDSDYTYNLLTEKMKNGLKVGLKVCSEPADH